MSNRLRLYYGIKSDAGMVRGVNQDRVLASFIDSPKGIETALFAVADGMGGTEGGEEASELAIERLKHWHTSIDIDNLVVEGHEKIINSLRKCFYIVNELIINYGREHRKVLGTTLSSILIIDRHFFLSHTGDSRIYLYKNNKAKQISLDHSFLAEQVRRGNLKPEDALNDSRKNLITQCLGIKEQIEVYTSIGKIKSNDTILLCSDGLYNHVKPENINGESFYGAKDNTQMQRMADQLVVDANKKGGHDNISVILLKAAVSRDLIAELKELIMRYLKRT